MVSITTWTRLEPRCRDATLQDGLEARLHDPLWMLARQWQLGEFAASDGGSPAQVRLGIACAPLSRYRPAAEDADAHPYDPRTQPLEAVVEREQPDQTGHGPDLRAAAEAGLHFVRLLRRHDVAGYAQAYRDRYPLPRPGGGEHPPGDDAERFLAVMGGRAIDGVRLHRDLADLPRADDGALERLPDEPPVTDDNRDAVATAAGRWLAWYEDTHGTPAQPPSCWSTQRMTHAFAVSAVTGHGEVALAASEHPGGRLDWDAFDHTPDVALHDGDPRPDEQASETATTVLPGRVRYRGMPTSRWWEFEDAGADLGKVATGPEDLARLVFVELAITYGNDWFLVPVDADVGSLSEVRSLVVTDTFGRRTLIRHHADVDGPDGRWRMFGLSAPADHPADRMLLLPPALPAGQRGPAVEEVLLRRDEVANLAWAIERTVPNVLGTPLDRRGARGGPDEHERARDAQAPSVYRLATDVPDHWFPLVPIRGPEPGQRRLVRGRMPAAEGEPVAEPWGALLRAVTPLVLLDEEVPRAGVRLTRRDERARWSDGSTHHWRARRRQIGGGEAWSGLRHDAVEPAERRA